MIITKGFGIISLIKNYPVQETKTNESIKTKQNLKVLIILVLFAYNTYLLIHSLTVNCPGPNVRIVVALSFYKPGNGWHLVVDACQSEKFVDIVRLDW